MATIQGIQEFLGRKRLAVVGVSGNSRDFTRTMFREFVRRGYDVVPVNPKLSEVEGIPCRPHLQDISPPVEGALLMTQPAVTEQVVEDCAQAGIRQVWMYRAAGAGAVSAKAVAFCRSQGIDVVDGECPFMFLEGASWPHKLHGLCRKMLRKYPGT